ncbi:HCP-like protein [Ascobolus immersus RN42]|uniref:HCP-like protein n=1 Tax=Ascobolus immersus RN42 TaxID=1160509 RepID=A0A3N4IRP2_ASCIM|nr:HCP-like protein [Ascobolus immersus RN42]
MAQQRQAIESPSASNPNLAGGATTSASTKAELLKESKKLLENIQGRLPHAQYILGDALANGVFNKGKPELEAAFRLFVAASKHGHSEAGYRAGLCYEFGWGCKQDPAKAETFYRQAASKNHPGAMTRLADACLTNDLGLSGRHREGVKWLKRATEVADAQHPSAPFKLGVLHETGELDDVFKDEAYAAQLYTQAAALGHAEANFKMGDAYEHGKLGCPKDPALSIHFYTGAAQQNHPEAMMCLCAWYMVGAEPVLQQNQEEAYSWALSAANLGFPKAEYAVGYFTELGIGTRQDSLEANVWYVKAAEHGDERAKKRLATIKANQLGDSGLSEKEKKKKNALRKEQKDAKDKDCCIM